MRTGTLEGAEISPLTFLSTGSLCTASFLSPAGLEPLISSRSESTALGWAWMADGGARIEEALPSARAVAGATLLGNLEKINIHERYDGLLPSGDQ